MQAWKFSLPLMNIKVIYKLLMISIEKVLINNEKDLTMTFVRDIIVEKKRLVTYYNFRKVLDIFD